MMRAIGVQSTIPNTPPAAMADDCAAAPISVHAPNQQTTFRVTGNCTQALYHFRDYAKWLEGCDDPEQEADHQQHRIGFGEFHERTGQWIQRNAKGSGERIAPSSSPMVGDRDLHDGASSWSVARQSSRHCGRPIDGKGRCHNNGRRGRQKRHFQY